MLSASPGKHFDYQDRLEKTHPPPKQQRFLTGNCMIRAGRGKSGMSNQIAFATESLRNTDSRQRTAMTSVNTMPITIYRLMVR